MSEKIIKQLIVNKDLLPFVFSKLTKIDYNVAENQRTFSKKKLVIVKGQKMELSIYAMPKAISRILKINEITNDKSQ